MPGCERRRGGIFTASGACFGSSDRVVSLDNGFLEGGLSRTPGIRHGRRVHAVTIHIEEAEIGRSDPPAMRPLCARCAPAGLSRDSGQLQRRFPAPTTHGIGEVPWLRLAST